MSANVCRLCLCVENLRPLFSDVDESDEFSAILMLTTGVEIKLNDGYPQTICVNCHTSVREAHHLRLRSQESQKKLTNDYKSPLPMIKIEIELDRLSDDCPNLDEDIPKIDKSEDIPKLEEKKPLITKLELSRKAKRELYLSMVDGQYVKNKPIKCKVCKKVINKWSSFVNHTKLHVGSKYFCEFCGKSCITNSQLKRHSRAFHGMEKTSQCSICNFRAIDNERLILHERRVHTGERPFICDYCGAAFFDRRCLIQHLNSHQKTTPVQCKKCKQMFKSRTHLANHKYNSHTSKEYSYKCPVCENIYKSRKYMRIHVKKSHGMTCKEVKIIRIKL